MKIRTYVIGTIIIFAILIAWILYDQNTHTSAPSPSSQDEVSGGNGGSQSGELSPRPLTVNKDGLIEVIVPQNLFGEKNMTAEEYVEYSRAAPNYDRVMTNVVANDNETATISFSPEQLIAIKQKLYDYAQFQNGYNANSIREVIYEDNMLTEITVLIDQGIYQQSWNERRTCNSVLAVAAGTFQVLSGIPSDEWHTMITIKDADTGKLISETYYPNEDMYTVE